MNKEFMGSVVDKETKRELFGKIFACHNRFVAERIFEEDWDKELKYRPALRKAIEGKNIEIEVVEL